MICAARDYADTCPEFAVAAGLAALRWIALGYGYEITGSDVMDAYVTVVHAASRAGIEAQDIKAQIRAMTDGQQPGRTPLLKLILADQLAS